VSVDATTIIDFIKEISLYHLVVFVSNLSRDVLQSKARSWNRMSSVRLSVRLSVTLVDCDDIGWNSSKIISPLVSLGCSLSADPNVSGLFQGEHPKIFARMGGCGKK